MPAAEPARIIVSRTVDMEAAEEVLTRAMVAIITGTRPRVSADDVAEMLFRRFNFADGDFTVHLHHLEDFLILFNSRASMDRMNGDHLVSCPRFTLSIRPWCKLAHAGTGGFEHHVELELYGIPAHAWHLETAEHILGASVWIERLHPRTRSRADLAMFRLAGRTHDPATIPREATLVIVEQLPHPTSSTMSVRTLAYPIRIALARTELDIHARRMQSSDHEPEDGPDEDEAGDGRDAGSDNKTRRKQQRRR